MKQHKCTYCGKKATIQTPKGKYQESIGAKPSDWGWYCKKCNEEGMRMEEEAIYG